MLILVLCCVLLTFPIGYLLVRRWGLRGFLPIAGVSFALYAIDALLVAAAIYVLAGDEAGSDPFGFATLAGMGMVVLAPVGIPIVLLAAFVMSRLQSRGGDTEAA